MNCRNKQFIFELAKQEDSKEILELLESGRYPGKISLMYTRRPDPYLSLMKEGERVLIVLCKDTISNKIAGIGCCAIRNVYLNGVSKRIGYFSGLKIKEEYRRKSSILYEAYEYMRGLLKEEKVELILNTILEENTYAQKLLEKKRKIMPEYKYIGTYGVYSIAFTSKKLPDSKYAFRKVKDSDIPKIVDFLNKEGAKKNLFPVVSEKDFNNGVYPGVGFDDFYMVADERQDIIAAGALWDQTEYKQYVVKSYGGILKILNHVSFMLPWFGYFKLPKVGEAIKFKTLSFWAIKDDNREIFRYFMENLRRIKSDSQFISVGLHESDNLFAIMDEFKNVSYKSRVYLVNWPEYDDSSKSFDKGIATYLECGML